MNFMKFQDFMVQNFLKIILDKVFSIIFLILSSPILLLSSLLIYIEDGFPILFTQNRTGWDGEDLKFINYEH